MQQDTFTPLEFLLFLLTSLFVIFIYVMIIRAIVKSIKKKKEKRRNKKAAIENQKNYEMQLGVIFKGSFLHFYGLPISDGILTTCYWCSDKIVFESNGATYNLPIENLLGVDIKTNTEIQKQYVSNAGKAIAGAELFGPVGALIGGRTQTKTTTYIQKFLIFTYLSKNKKDVKYVALKVISTPQSREYDFIRYFNSLPKKENVSFDL